LCGPLLPRAYRSELALARSSPQRAATVVASGNCVAFEVHFENVSNLPRTATAMLSGLVRSRRPCSEHRRGTAIQLPSRNPSRSPFARPADRANDIA
jgi:hypothetical protein